MFVTIRYLCHDSATVAFVTAGGGASHQVRTMSSNDAQSAQCGSTPWTSKSKLKLWLHNHYFVTSRKTMIVTCFGPFQGTVTLWTPNISAPVVKMLCHRGPVNDVSIDRSGKYVILCWCVVWSCGSCICLDSAAVATWQRVEWTGV